MRTLTLTGNRLLMLLFLVLFLAPIFWVQQALHHGWLDDPPRVTHHGVRMQPPVGVVQLGPELEQSSLTSDFLRQNWWLVYILPEDCTADCQVQQEKMRTAFAELDGKDLQLLIANPGGQESPVLRQEATDFHWLPVSASATNHALRGWIDSAPLATEASHLYVMNPQGSLMMHYPPEIGAEAIVADLTRLLP